MATEEAAATAAAVRANQNLPTTATVARTNQNIAAAAPAVLKSIEMEEAPAVADANHTLPASSSLPLVIGTTSTDNLSPEKQE